MNKLNPILMSLAIVLMSLCWACNENKSTAAASGGAQMVSTDDDQGDVDEEGDEDEKDDEEGGAEDSDNEEGEGDEDEEIKTFPDEHFEQFEAFDASLFDENSINITNQWLPMNVGRQHMYKGSDVGEEGERIEHSIVFTVTDLTKRIAGVNCIVLFENDYTEGGELEESELAFFAQDKAGNVWHLGQYVELYDGDEFLGGNIWVVDLVDDARAGIFMPAAPIVDKRSYSMGFAPAPFNWTDRFVVHETGKEIKNASGQYTNVLVTREYSKKEPNAYQLKYYAAGVGNIGVGYIGNDPNAETMDLIESKQLNAAELANIREEAMKLEKRASVYGKMASSQPRR